MGKNSVRVVNENRLQGECVHWSERRGFGILISEDGEYFVARDEIKGNGIGQQFLASGERVSFLVGQSHGGSRLPAINVIPVNRPLFEQIPSDYRETVLLEKWDAKRGCGFCRRGIDGGIGGTLILSAQDIITEGLETLQEGSSRPWVGIGAPLNGKRYFRAIMAEILIPEEPKPKEGYSDLVAIMSNPRDEWERIISQATRF
jgi:cold shock CspA family protein